MKNIDKKSLTLKTLNKSNVWDVQENDIFRLLEAAENRLEEARGELRQQNFPMEAEGW